MTKPAQLEREIADALKRGSGSTVRAAPVTARELLIESTRELVETAQALDPYHAEEVIMAVLGRPVFVWDSLTDAQLHSLGRRLFVTARLST